MAQSSILSRSSLSSAFSPFYQCSLIHLNHHISLSRLVPPNKNLAPVLRTLALFGSKKKVVKESGCKETNTINFVTCQTWIPNTSMFCLSCFFNVDHRAKGTT